MPVIEMTTTASTDRNIQEEEEEGDLKGVIIVTTRWRKIIVIIDAFSGIPCITPKTRQASVLLVDADSVSTYLFQEITSILTASIRYVAKRNLLT
ncbi:hypothetical protein KER56_11960 [Escherichia coli]|nr:hypothetical protein [Escherichia coli]